MLVQIKQEWENSAKVYSIQRIHKDLFSWWWKVEQQKSNLPLWSRRGLSSVFWNQQGCKCTQTELGNKCLFMSLGVSVTWPKTTATQKGRTVPATCQPRPRTGHARKPCGAGYEHEHGSQDLGSEWVQGVLQGKMPATASAGPRQLNRSQHRNHRTAEDGRHLFWRSPGPTSQLKQSQLKTA